MSLRTKRTMGAIGVGAIVSVGSMVIGWLLIQVYTNIATRVTSVEAQTATLSNTVVSDHQDIQWIRAALEKNSITP